MDETLKNLTAENAKLNKEAEMLAACNEQASDLLGILDAEVTRLRDENAKLRAREGKSTVELLTPTPGDTWAREALTIEDFGVADNCYVVSQEKGELNDPE